MSDEELKGLNLEGKTFGVIGVCGVVGNLVARIIMDNGYEVIGTDISSKEDCRFYSSFDDYDIEIFFGGHPDEFFKQIDFIVPPPSMSDDAKVLSTAKEFDIEILHLGDIFRLFKANKPILCISGTNGKTTTTTLLKHIAYSNGISPAEHNLKGMQGNNEFIPSLQTRLHGDVAILETGTDGTPGGLKSVIDLTHPNYGILTNITIDHLVDPDDHKDGVDESLSAISLDIGDDEVSHIDRGFLEYARVKGELIEGIQENDGLLIYNSDDPTIVGLLDKLNYSGKSISFGVEIDEFDNFELEIDEFDFDSSFDSVSPIKIHTKPCWCGRDIKIYETISGSGFYECQCGIKYENPDFIAKDIDLVNRSFNLASGDDEFEFKLTLDGLHNVYNAVGAIIAAKEFLGLSNQDIQKGLSTFKGVAGRMEIIDKIKDTTIMVDYAHNPAGVETILDAISRIYDKTCVVITVSSESGVEGDFDILDSAIGKVDYIVPASHDCRYAADKLIELTKENRQEELHLNSVYTLDDLCKTFVLTDEDLKQESIKTLGASEDQVIRGLKEALNLDTDIILIIGEAAFKFESAIKDFCDSL